MYPAGHGQDDEVAQALAERMGGWALHLLVHDDDIFAYWLYRDGRVIDSFWSAPGYFGDENLAREEAMAGNPSAFAPLIGDRFGKLSSLLIRGEGAQPTVASETLEAFGKVLKINNTVMAYEHLKEKGTEGIKGRRLFVEVPLDAANAEKQQKLNAEKSYREALRRLQSDGLLLLNDTRKDILPNGCAVEGGFFVAWQFGANGSFAGYQAPWDAPTTVVLNSPTLFGKVAADGEGRRVVISTQELLCVCDASKGRWSQITLIPVEKGCTDSTISRDGRTVAHASRSEVVLSDVASGRRLLALPMEEGKKLAFHPSGNWMALSARSGLLLSFLSLEGEPRLRNVYVGSKVDPNAISGQRIRSKLISRDPGVMSAEAKRAIDAMLAKLTGGRSKKSPMTEEQVAELRQSMEKHMAEAQAKLSAIREGKADLFPSQGAERVTHVGFTRNGRWMWCGTERGMLVFDWTATPREDGAELTAPTWRFDTPPKPDHAYSQMTTAVAEDSVHQTLIFGDTVGRIYGMELTTGNTQELLALPGNRRISEIVLSADGQALGVASSMGSFLRDLKGIWEVWSYPKLVNRL